MDAAVWKDDSTFALVVRDENGHLILLKMITHPHMSLFLVELETLKWVVGEVTSSSWARVIWNVIAQQLEKDVNGR